MIRAEKAIFLNFKFHRWNIMKSKEGHFVIGPRILDTAKAKKISQETLAKKLKLGQSAVSAWRKMSNPPIDKIEQIAKILGVSVEYLVTGCEPVTKEPPKNLAGDERKLLLMYRGLNDSNKQKVLDYVLNVEFDTIK